MTHELTETHISNVTDLNAFYYTIPDELKTIEDVKNGTIVAFEGEKLAAERSRMFCTTCLVPMDSKLSVAKKHINGKRHSIKVGIKMNSVDEVIAKYANQIQRNPDRNDDVDCFVCDKQGVTALKQIGARKLLEHVTCAKHQSILKQSDDYDAFISPFVPNKPFAVQREKAKIQKMRNIASRHSQIVVIFDNETKQHKYYCHICQKHLLGRNDHLLDHHVNSATHTRFEKSPDGTSLDDFLFEFFTILVKGNT